MLRKHADDTRAVQKRAPPPRQARDCPFHQLFGIFTTSEGGDNLTELAADDMYLNCHNKEGSR